MKAPSDLLQQGLAHLQAGRIPSAAAAFEQLVAQEPRNLEAWCRLANTREFLRNWSGAIDAYRRAAALKPDFAAVHCNLGAALLRVEDGEAAKTAFEEALRHQPEFPEALNGLAVALKQGGRCDEAAEALRRAVALRPQYAEAHYNLGNTRQAQERWSEAIDAYRTALALEPRSATTLHNLASALCQIRAYTEAAELERRAAALAPRWAEAHNGLGNALLGQGQVQAAEAAFRAALSLNSNYAEALCNLGNTLLAQNAPERAVDWYREAQARRPDLPEAHFNEAIALLLRGHLREGFAKYEWRWQSEQKQQRRALDLPPWTGPESLEGKTIYIHCEQGIGDTLQFARYVPMLAVRGAQVIFEVQAPLADLMAQLPGTRVMIRGESSPSNCDFHAALLSLPAAFGTTLESIPATVPYLRAPETHRQAWRPRLAAFARPRVGVVCSGNARHKNDHQRSVPLSAFEALTETLGAPLHLVQKDLKTADAAHLAHSRRFIDWSDDLHDFSDTAALVAELDLIITVDTSVAHLAGALGKPVWILLPYAPDWRWLLGRVDSPWYPTARLFRQPTPQAWQPVFDDVAAALSGWQLVAQP